VGTVSQLLGKERRKERERKFPLKEEEKVLMEQIY
jgi:hypothetical protein